MNKLLLNKILIANRGEIACRVIRTAQRMDIKTVGLYNDADKNSKHVSMVDEAYYIGSNTLADSYNNIAKILDVAKKTNSDGVHPGYGFLSENSKFVREVERNGIKFIGPPSTAIDAMGNKSESKNIMLNANVPVVPGYHGSNQEDKFLFEEAKKIGFPMLIKAVLGGGGKGMRTVFKPEDFFSALDSARREAMKSFSDENILVEKFIKKPKHIEVQVFGDHHGNYVHLFERDCSIQRRHQKIIEEAPSFLSHEKRMEIGECAVKAAEAVGYYNAGTVEFIYDTIDNNFYFMEMNTRLQVEHPISEEITGQDFVEWQIRVASGEKLPLRQDQLKIHGHAIESRIYAEDPDSEFLPQSGKIHYLREPRNRDSHVPDNNVRVDTGVRQGDEVSIYFDPMVSKLIVHGENRADAIQKMKKALNDYKIVGLKNNITFLMKICEEEAFLKNDYDTDFIENYRKSLFCKPFTKVRPRSKDVVFSALIELMKESKQIESHRLVSYAKGNPWFIQDAFRVNYHSTRTVRLTDEDDKVYNVEINYLSTNEFNIRIIDGDLKTDFNRYRCYLMSDNQIVIESDDDKRTVEFFLDEQDRVHTMRRDGGVVSLKVKTDKFGDIEGGNVADLVTSPMPGKIVKIFSKRGDKVSKGQQLLSLESMKMEHLIKAEREGVIKEIHTVETDFVQIGAKLVEFETHKQE
jgi:3-methylcrotonyl-CoA carboxylase alpha subunit